MKNCLLNLYAKALVVRGTLADENGQDLVEYALVLGLICFAAVAGMGLVATNLSAAFTKIATAIGANQA
jgi:pilus assembly protein Flp/PilA